MNDEWREFIEQVQRAQHVAIREGECPRFDLVECAMALWREATEAAPSQPEAKGDELSPREVEAQEAFTGLRDEVLNYSEGLDNDQINAILSVIDNHTPEWV